jgi:FAD/FMN-containing dehydrogenase
VADTCQIGGNIASNAGGLNVLRYGNTREQVLGLEVVLPNGDVWADMRPLRKNNLGLDIKQLFIGSEGTLGIITKACLRLYPALQHRVTAILGMESIDQVLDAYQHARSLCNDTLNAFELIPHEGVELVLAHRPKLHDPLTTPYPFYVMMEVASSQPKLTTLNSIVAGICDDMGYPYHLATTPTDHDNIWSIRTELPWVQREEGASLKHDIALPLSRLPAFMVEASQAVLKYLPATRIIAFGHIGDGNVHYNLMQPKDMERATFLAKQDAFADIIHNLVLKYNGTISAEHGIGLQKRGMLAKLASPAELWLRESIKRSIDPLNLMNTGKGL